LAPEVEAGGVQAYRSSWSTPSSTSTVSTDMLRYLEALENRCAACPPAGLTVHSRIAVELIPMRKLFVEEFNTPATVVLSNELTHTCI
jgi:hypothetical protein